MANTAPQNKKNSTLIEDYQASLGAMEQLHNSFDDKEKILLSQPLGKINKEETKTRISDPTLLAAVIKQNNSTMAQMPSGKITALTKDNRGKSLFMDLIFHKHVIPNATSQYDVFTKLWLLSFYRKVYGSMGVLVDFVNGGGYGKGNAGPDFTILPIRSIIPQVGKYTETDCDYIYVRSRVSKKWLEDKKGDKNWKNIDKVLERKGDFTMEFNSSSYVERKTENGMVKREEYEIVTRYEPDKWITFHSGSQEILREMDNPQKNGKIPIIMCHSYPLLDRFIGLGDFERGMDLHTSLGSLISLYLDGAKAGIFPNLKIDPAAIENWNEIKQHGIGPGQIWLMKPQLFDKLEQMHVTPDLNTFQSTYQFLKAAVLTVTNTTDTSVNQATDPGFGKTPQALKMQSFSQGMQTQFDRRMLEIATEKIFDRMIDLVAKRQEKPMHLYLGKADLEAVAEIAPDVVEMFEVGDMGKVTIKPTDVKDCDYRYEIDAGSTVKKDEIVENQTLTQILEFVMKVPGAMESLMQGGKIPLGNMNLDLGELIKRWVISSGVTDWDKIIVDNEQQENGLNMEDPNAAQAVGSVLNPQGGQPPMGVNQPPMEQSQFQDPSIAQVFAEIQSMAGGQR
ncbi:MAG: hypothetical protein HY865_22565 [Chloroflexi bacterium]|nr:hypothetical protein [Chloroflexota bacterium]